MTDATKQGERREAEDHGAGPLPAEVRERLAALAIASERSADVAHDLEAPIAVLSAYAMRHSDLRATAELLGTVALRLRECTDQLACEVMHYSHLVEDVAAPGMDAAPSLRRNHGVPRHR